MGVYFNWVYFPSDKPSFSLVYRLDYHPGKAISMKWSFQFITIRMERAKPFFSLLYNNCPWTDLKNIYNENIYNENLKHGPTVSAKCTSLQRQESKRACGSNGAISDAPLNRQMWPAFSSVSDEGAACHWSWPDTSDRCEDKQERPAPLCGSTNVLSVSEPPGVQPALSGVYTSRPGPACAVSTTNDSCADQFINLPKRT